MCVFSLLLSHLKLSSWELQVCVTQCNTLLFDKVSYVPMGPFFSRQHNLGDTACGCPRIQKTATFLQTFVPEGKHSTKYHHHENNSNSVGKEEGGSQATEKEIEGF